MSSNVFDFKSGNTSLSTFSMYKIIGMPTAVGGLIIKKSLLGNYKVIYDVSGKIMCRSEVCCKGKRSDSVKSNLT